MAMKKTRSMKVYEQSGYNYRATPTIMLKGLWLEELGFTGGCHIRVECENGRLVITPDTQRDDEEAAKAEFMEWEMRQLQERFQTEKKALCAQYVTAKKVDYAKEMEGGK